MHVSVHVVLLHATKKKDKNTKSVYCCCCMWWSRGFRCAGNQVIACTVWLMAHLKICCIFCCCLMTVNHAAQVMIKCDDRQTWLLFVATDDVVVCSRQCVKPYLTLSVYKYSRTSWKALWLTLLSRTIWSLPSGVVLMELPSVLMTSCSLMTVVVVDDDDMLGGWFVGSLIWFVVLVAGSQKIMEVFWWLSPQEDGLRRKVVCQSYEFATVRFKRRDFAARTPYENFYFEFSPRLSWPTCWRLQYMGWKYVHVSGFHVLWVCVVWSKSTTSIDRCQWLSH